MGIAIQVDNVSKQYRLGKVGTGTLSHDLNRWWYRVRGKEDPYLKIGETNDRSRKGVSEYVWALRNINFEIEQGDAVGIIGRNGAGKSTLLKILSRTTGPTSGTVLMKGRVASLLEVGTGFHSELTGRENIFLNGAILGMTKHEIQRKFDEIVDFSGVERYIDTPVKRYSSGMYVRLGFAVAAFLEPEILIVDEVLAVGDSEFQRKAIGKMQDVSNGDGRTVLIVSHNMDSIMKLCKRSIVMDKGAIVDAGDSVDVIGRYLSGDAGRSLQECRGAWDRSLGTRAEVTAIETRQFLVHGENLVVVVEVSSRSEHDLNNLNFSIALMDELNNVVFNSYTRKGFSLASGEVVQKTFHINSGRTLMPGKYKLGLSLLQGILPEDHLQLDSIFGYSEVSVLRSPDTSLDEKWDQRYYGSIVLDLKEIDCT